MYRPNQKLFRGLRLTPSSIMLILAPSFGLQAQDLAEPPALPVPQQTSIIDDAANQSAEGVTPIMQGPLHEAFVEQFSSDPEPAAIITSRPPEIVDERPPEFKPDGNNVQWIPGYWGWDLQAQDFVWVSGIWRQVPAQQQWIPGYWAEVDGGWQWVSGFWNADDTDEIAYLPAPPASIDAGPSDFSPDENSFWVAGSWHYDQGNYVWQSGSWAPSRADQIWVPTRYLWTPSGYVYRPGYWDYAVVDRGTLFCPVLFQPGYQQTYRPSYCVEIGPSWFANLFVAPGFSHYYYGVYYGYSGPHTFYPWLECQQQSRPYDPLYSYYAYQSRNAGWLQQLGLLERQYKGNQRVFASRPTVAAYLQTGHNQRAGHRHNGLHVASLQSIAQQRSANFNSPFAYRRLDSGASRDHHASVAPVKQIARQRFDYERSHKHSDAPKSSGVTVNKSNAVNTDATSLKKWRFRTDRPLANNSTSANRDRINNPGQPRPHDRTGGFPGRRPQDRISAMRPNLNTPTNNANTNPDRQPNINRNQAAWQNYNRNRMLTERSNHAASNQTRQVPLPNSSGLNNSGANSPSTSSSANADRHANFQRRSGETAQGFNRDQNRRTGAPGGANLSSLRPSNNSRWQLAPQQNTNSGLSNDLQQALSPDRPSRGNPGRSTNPASGSNARADTGSRAGQADNRSRGQSENARRQFENRRGSLEGRGNNTARPSAVQAASSIDNASGQTNVNSASPQRPTGGRDRMRGEFGGMRNGSSNANDASAALGAANRFSQSSNGVPSSAQNQMRQSREQFRSQLMNNLQTSAGSSNRFGGGNRPQSQSQTAPAPQSQNPASNPTASPARGRNFPNANIGGGGNSRRERPNRGNK